MDSDDRREQILAWRRSILELAPPDRPTLIAVAEVAVDRAPWPLLASKTQHEIRLRPGLSHPELGTLVASSIYYGDEPPPAESLFTANLGADYAILIGGIYSIGFDGTVIRPGCCVGLEDWRQWVGAESSWDAPEFGHGPHGPSEAWMSNDPNVVSIEHGEWDWPEEPKVVERIVFTHNEYRAAIGRLQADIDSFAVQVLDWAVGLSPEIGPLWAEHWLGNLDMLPGAVRPPTLPP